RSTPTFRGCRATMSTSADGVFALDLVRMSFARPETDVVTREVAAELQVVIDDLLKDVFFHDPIFSGRLGGAGRGSLAGRFHLPRQGRSCYASRLEGVARPTRHDDDGSHPLRTGPRKRLRRSRTPEPQATFLEGPDGPPTRASPDQHAGLQPRGLRPSSQT